jgi:hypothetical protein
MYRSEGEGVKKRVREQERREREQERRESMQEEPR